MTKMIKNNKGFTLIEIFVCLSVISLLSFIALPVFGYSKKKAIRVQAESALTELWRLQALYVVDNSQYTASTADLGYTILNQEPLTRYALNINLAADKRTYVATLTGNLDNDADQDIITINQNKTITILSKD